MKNLDGLLIYIISPQLFNFCVHVISRLFACAPVGNDQSSVLIYGFFFCLFFVLPLALQDAVKTLFSKFSQLGLPFFFFFF